jgi:hypothetical protein
MLIQIQRVRADGVVVDYQNLVTTQHREYDDVRRTMERELRSGETIRCVSDDSGFFRKTLYPSPEDLQ